jgi:AcrR family transcriptional regulator
MPDFKRALTALRQMARLLDAVMLATPNRYERVTDAYQTALVEAYDTWARWTTRELEKAVDDTARAEVLAIGEKGLRGALQRVGTEYLPNAVSAIGATDYVPSPAAWRMIAEAIETQNNDIATRLVPYVIESLQRGIAEQTDLRAVAESLAPRVASYAGNLWIVIHRLVGDFAAQAQARDDLIYPARWVRVRDDRSCESCIQFEGVYESYDALLQATGQCVPGYFVGSPYSACWLNCRCYIELKIDGVWTRV